MPICNKGSRRKMQLVTEIDSWGLCDMQHKAEIFMCDKQRITNLGKHVTFTRACAWNGNASEIWGQVWTMVCSTWNSGRRRSRSESRSWLESLEIITWLGFGIQLDVEIRWPEPFGDCLNPMAMWGPFIEWSENSYTQSTCVIRTFIYIKSPWQLYWIVIFVEPLSTKQKYCQIA